MNPIEDMNRRAREAERRAQDDLRYADATRFRLHPQFRSVDTAGMFLAALIVAIIVLLVIVF